MISHAVPVGTSVIFNDNGTPRPAVIALGGAALSTLVVFDTSSTPPARTVTGAPFGTGNGGQPRTVGKLTSIRRTDVPGLRQPPPQFIARLQAAGVIP